LPDGLEKRFHVEYVEEAEAWSGVLRDRGRNFYTALKRSPDHVQFNLSNHQLKDTVFIEAL
jgi:hypothetical protein